MALNFPANPVIGDVYTVGNSSWVWNGVNWASGASLEGTQSPPIVTISDTAPIPTTLGELWWNSSTGQLKIYYDDGTSVQWVDANSSLVTQLDYLTADSVSTLTNKTISYGSNTITGVAPLASPTFTGTVTLPSTTSIGTVSNIEIGYLDGTTSSIQTQLNSKAPLASPTFTGTVSAATFSGSGASLTSLPAASLSGTVGIANGGTGTSTSPTEGQLLIGNGTGYTLGTLTPGTGINISNTSGAVTISSSSGSVSITTAQAISAGSPVTVNSNGLLVPVSPVVNISTTPTATSYSFFLVGANNAAGYSSSFNAYDSNTGAYIVVFRGNSDNYLKYTVGSISGTTVTEGVSGTFVSAFSEIGSIVKVDSNKVVVFYKDGSNYLKAILVQFTNASASILSGPITLSTYSGGNITSKEAAFLPNMSKVYVLTREGAYTYVIGLNYTGNAISLISKSDSIYGFYDSIQNAMPNIATNGDKLVAICYTTNSYTSVAMVGTIQADGSVSWTLPSLSLPRWGALAYEPKSGKFLFCGSDGSSTNTAHSITLSGTTLSQVHSASFSTYGFTFDSALVSSNSEGDFCTLLTYEYSSSTNKTALRTIYNLSNSTFSISQPYIVNTDSNISPVIRSLSYIGTGKVFDTIGYGNQYGVSQSYRVATLGSVSAPSAYLGISAASYSQGQTALVTTAGSVNTAVSGLSTGSTYYVQINGTLGTGSTSLVAGIALSPTSILVK